MTRPHLTFFCELGTQRLAQLFAGQAVIDDLVSLEAGVSLGLLDLSPARAEVVRRLNDAAIPVVAWQLLPEAQGYWFNLDNAAQAAARYEAFRGWSAKEGLRWAAVGLDIEPDMRMLERLLHDRWRVLPALVGRVFDYGRLRHAQDSYGALVARIRADGYRVESYQVPFIVDGRRAGSTLLERLAGLVDLEVDREVLMLYSSYMRPSGAAWLQSYAPDAQAIAVGSTGGGVTIGGADRIPPLDWGEFSRDLHLAAERSRDIYVFSLEGCIAQDFLCRLKVLDWHQPSVLPMETSRRVDRVRSVVRAALCLEARPIVVLAALATVGLLTRRLRRRH